MASARYHRFGTREGKYVDCNTVFTAVMRWRLPAGSDDLGLKSDDSSIVFRGANGVGPRRRQLFRPFEPANGRQRDAVVRLGGTGTINPGENTAIALSRIR